MKKNDLLFAALLVPFDFVFLLAAGYAAYFLRFQALTDLQPVIYQIPPSIYTSYAIGVGIFTILIYALSGLYHFGHDRVQNEVSKIITACSTSFMLVIVFIFFIQELFSSRFIILAAWLLAIAFTITGRLLLRIFRLILFRYSIGSQRVAIIGSDKRTKEFISEIERRLWLGYRLAFHAERLTDAVFERLRQVAAHGSLDGIIVIDANLESNQLRALIEFADIHHVSIRYSADMIGEKNIEISTVLGVPLIHFKRTRLHGWGRIMKRSFDMLIGLVLTAGFLPIAFFVAIAIRLDSPGPIIYRNVRVGQDGKLFDTYKFRSMFQQHCTGPQYDKDGAAEQYQRRLVQNRSVRHGPVFKVLDDPRRTRVGRFLERTSLDELPQFINVLKGNMSLVGPRPHMPSEVEGYRRAHYQLFRVKPGITGLAQISGRSDIDFEDEARLDIYYLEHWSLLLDLAILLKTPYAVLTRRSNV
ncbi:sugar transferase [Candidatus Uhrbacteria bacterium]|nr:sugar transferase [Candidatus Uhrbacteria bacterium]